MNEVKLITEDQLNRLMQVKGAKQLQQMYAKTKGQQGGNFAEDVGKWFQSTGKNVDDFLKRTKVISKAGKLAKYVLPLLGPEGAAAIPVTEGVASAADSLGYGMKGKGFISQVGTGMGESGIIETNFETTSLNGVFQDVVKPIFTEAGEGFVGGPYATVSNQAKPFAGVNSGIVIGPLSMGQMGNGSMKCGAGLGAMNTISNNSRVAF